MVAVCDVTEYLGAQGGQNPVDNSPAAVVTRLILPVSGSGRNITTDNWYSSVPLALSLKRNHRLTLVGTIRKNRKEVPLEFVRTQQRELYSTMFGFTDDLTIFSYKAKSNRVVTAISSMHHDATINHESGDRRKPESITFYNTTKGGVDTHDQLAATYSVARRTRRWPMVIFYAVLNTAITISNNASNIILK